MATRHSFVAIICDSRYKLNILSFLFETEGGSNSPLYRKAKAYFEAVYGQYNRRAIGLRDLERYHRENAEIEARELRERQSPSPEPEDEWRVNPFYGYEKHLAQQ